MLRAGLNTGLNPRQDLNLGNWEPIASSLIRFARVMRLGRRASVSIHAAAATVLYQMN